MTADEPIHNYELINQELSEFGNGLAEKPQILALNKVDVPDAQAQMELLESVIDGMKVPVVRISAATGQGTGELAQQALWTLRALQEEEAQVTATAIPVITPEARRTGRYEAYLDDDGVAVIDGPTPTWLARTLDLHDRDPREEFFGRLRRMGVHRSLRRLGVTEGDLVRVGDVEVRWEE